MAVPAARHELIDNPDGSQTRYSYFDASEETLVRLVRELFQDHWPRLTVGPWVLGAVFELTFDRAPKVTIENGYLTVDAGAWHFHLCIANYKGSGSPESHLLRRVSKVAFYDWRGDGSIKERSSGIRMWNGYGEQMTTIFFPHVLLGETSHTVGPSVPPAGRRPVRASGTARHGGGARRGDAGDAAACPAHPLLPSIAPRWPYPAVLPPAAGLAA